jgi:hypothetical protein
MESWSNTFEFEEGERKIIEGWRKIESRKKR